MTSKLAMTARRELVGPNGGVLVDLGVDEAKREALAALAGSLPRSRSVNGLPATRLRCATVATTCWR